jgi:hypothetical protein
MREQITKKNVFRMIIFAPLIGVLAMLPQTSSFALRINSPYYMCHQTVQVPDLKNCKVVKESEPTNSSVLEEEAFTYDSYSKLLTINNKQKWMIGKIIIEYSDTEKASRGNESNGFYETKFKIQPGGSRSLTLDRPDLCWDLNSMDQADLGKAAIADKILSIRAFSAPEFFCAEEYTQAELEQKAVELERIEKEREEERKASQKRKKILTNCVADKLPPRPDPTYKKSILSICERASENPTFWNKIWYDYFGQ